MIVNRSPPRHRSCTLVRGTSAQTRAEALRLLAGMNLDGTVLWVGDDGAPGVESCPARQVGRLLGRAFDAVVLDAHGGFDGDALGQLHGMIWGGGALIVRRPNIGARSEPTMAQLLAVIPYGVDDVGQRFDAHVERALQNCGAAEAGAIARRVSGTPDQLELVRTLVHVWQGDAPSRVVLQADRGRGKSSALGLALASRGTADFRIAVSGPRRSAVAELLRFAPDNTPFVPPTEIGRDRFDLVILDEAAQLPVPTLQRVVADNHGAHLAFSSTTHGYEGSGRGFSLRFVDWLARRKPPVRRLTLREPIRWDADDPLERAIFDALLLDSTLPHVSDGNVEGLELRRLDRDQLASQQLREFFGLLLHAHYRTTPSDLHRILDAPNLSLHAAVLRGRIVAATVVAREGGLSPQQCAQVHDGSTRIGGHALADAIVAHMGEVEAGALDMLRSVRIAVHPALRRRGIATQLVQHVHREHAPALFGTMFGATPDVIAFRRELGYEVVRVSASRGTRTGEPSVMMLRACTTEAGTLISRLRVELAHDIDTQLCLLEADDLLLDPALKATLRQGLPVPAPRPAARCLELTQAYAYGPRTFEASAAAVIRTVRARAVQVAALPDRERAVVEARVLAGRGWRRAMVEAGLPTIRATMRTLRQAVRQLLATG